MTKAITETRLTLTAFLILFVGLKLGGVIDWPWWLVLAPFWVPAVISLICGAWLLIGRKRL